MHFFARFLMGFYCVFTGETYTFNIFFIYTRKHMYHFLYRKCYVLPVFWNGISLCIHCTNMYFWYISRIFKNSHVLYFIHELHCFVCVFMCFHCKNMFFGTFHIYTRIHMYHTFFMKYTVLIVFSCVYTAKTCSFCIFHIDARRHMYHT
jgi:hypothetical protein